MKQASTTILSKKNIALLDKLGIEYAPLHNSKKNELAFTSCNHSKREFEVRYMANGTFRIGTRFLGYVGVLNKQRNQVVKKKDPDQRRYSFYVTLYTEEEVNKVISEMLMYGYDSNPKIENI